MLHNTNKILTTFPVFTSGHCTDLHINISHHVKREKLRYRKIMRAASSQYQGENLKSVHPRCLLLLVF